MLETYAKLQLIYHPKNYSSKVEAQIFNFRGELIKTVKMTQLGEHKYYILDTRIDTQYKEQFPIVYLEDGVPITCGRATAVVMATPE